MQSGSPDGRGSGYRYVVMWQGVQAGTCAESTLCCVISHTQEQSKQEQPAAHIVTAATSTLPACLGA